MDKIDYRIHKLFPVPVYHSTIPAPDVLTFNKLISNEWVAPGYLEYSDNHRESEDRHILDNPSFKSIKKHIQDHIENYAYDVLGTSRKHTWQITTSWVNQSEPGHDHAPHFHANSILSGVVYLQSVDTAEINFHRSASHVNLWNTVLLDFEGYNELNVDVISIHPSTNEILIFPSNLTHSVNLNKSNETRYSLAFNVFPRGVFGEGGNSELVL